MIQASPSSLQAAADLIRRYGAVFRQAWRERERLDGQPRLRHETQFLPAALALEETPVSPAPRLAMWLLMTFALIALGWSIFGKLEVVATAQGKIVPSDRSKVIQPIETATVTAIHVADGQSVNAGDLLIELDATSAVADTARIANDLAAARLQAARARALLAGIAAGKAPIIDAPAQIDPRRIAREQVLLDGQYAELQAKIARIDAEIGRREAELRSTQEIVRKLELTVPIARQRAQDFKELAEKNFVSQHGYLDREQARIEQEADLATQRGRLKEIAAGLNESASQKMALLAEFRRLTLDSLNDAEQKGASNEQELVKAETRGKLMKLAAPVEGTVQQLAVHTIGGVVTPAQQLMVIVPRDNPLEVEAFLQNKDIGFVNPGQEAEVKIETFPYTKFGTVRGWIEHVSDDAINDEKRGLIYSTRVRLERVAMQVSGKSLNLTPGMAVTVEIKTDRRRVIEYFLSPLLQYANESLRER